MKIFQCKQIKELDQYTIEHEPIRSVDLMERAADALCEAIISRWGKETPFVVFAGQGNNGGDALAVARKLIDRKYDVEIYLFNTSGKLSEDCALNCERLRERDHVKLTEVTKQFQMPELTAQNVVIDGLFGTGLNRPLGAAYATLIDLINKSDATVVAIDIPSGLNGDGIRFDVYPNAIVKADLTLTLQMPKMAFFFAENEDVIGEWEVLDIGLSEEGIDNLDTPFSLVDEYDVKSLIEPRKKFAHKGDFGHALLIAGSYGMAGASILAAKACLRSGVGLLTVHVPSLNVPVLQTAVPEAMVEPDLDAYYYTNSPIAPDDYDAVAI